MKSNDRGWLIRKISLIRPYYGIKSARRMIDVQSNDIDFDTTRDFRNADVPKYSPHLVVSHSLFLPPCSSSS